MAVIAITCKASGGLFLTMPYDISRIVVEDSMKRGDIVEVVEFGGRKLRRRVVADKGEFTVVCNEEEYKKAVAERREPAGVGFPARCVLRLRNDDQELPA